jgi:hypothetical protein
MRSAASFEAPPPPYYRHAGTSGDRHHHRDLLTAQIMPTARATDEDFLAVDGPRTFIPQQRQSSGGVHPTYYRPAHHEGHVPPPPPPHYHDPLRYSRRITEELQRRNKVAKPVFQEGVHLDGRQVLPGRPPNFPRYADESPPHQYVADFYASHPHSHVTPARDGKFGREMRADVLREKESGAEAGRAARNDAEQSKEQGQTPAKRARLKSKDNFKERDIQGSASASIEGQFDDAPEEGAGSPRPSSEVVADTSVKVPENSREYSGNQYPQSAGQGSKIIDKDECRRLAEAHHEGSFSKFPPSSRARDMHLDPDRYGAEDASRLASLNVHGYADYEGYPQSSAAYPPADSYSRALPPRGGAMPPASRDEMGPPFRPGYAYSDYYSPQQHHLSRSQSNGYPYPPAPHSGYRSSPTGAAYITPPHSHTPVASTPSHVLHSRPPPPLRGISSSDHAYPSIGAGRHHPMYYDREAALPGPPSRYVSVSQGSLPPHLSRTMRSLSCEEFHESSLIETDRYRPISDYRHDTTDRRSFLELGCPSGPADVPIHPRPGAQVAESKIRDGTDRYPSPEDADSPEYITMLNENDVLLGRGKGVNDYVGNRKFREFVKTHRQEYLGSSRGDKTQIARQIVGQVCKLNPPGRFLKKVSNTRYWVVVESQVALEKTSQALREGSPQSVGGDGIERKTLNKCIKEEAEASPKLKVNTKNKADEQS